MKSDFSAHVGQGVLDLRRDGGNDSSPQETIPFQSLQRLGQHLFTDAAYTSSQFTEASGAIQK
jgi:hypothetical protein